MAVTGVSPGYPYAVGTVSQGGKYKFGTYPCRTGDSYYSKIMRVLKPTYTGKISSAITTPVAQKSGNFRLPVVHYILR